MSSAAERICMECGLCCNGVIFAHGQLQPGDNTSRLQALGLQFKESRDSHRPAALPKFKQPCAAFEGCKCGIYAERPVYCRRFECALLKQVNAGERTPEAALRIIGTAKKRAAKVRRLLAHLGDASEDVALGNRFRRTSNGMHERPVDHKSAKTFGDLTVAMHQLTALISEKFYPGSG